MLASTVASLLIMASPNAPAPINDIYQKRAADWRNGAVVYQVFVDRFVPPTNLKEKAALYPAPDKLHEWTETPHGTGYDYTLKTYPHVLDFWGGDIPGLRTKLGYVKELGANVLYLQPIFQSPSNHKYDTEDYFKVDPQYGSEADLWGLKDDVHGLGMKLMLDGVFNHIGVTSPIFETARANVKDPRRDWFFFGNEYPNGYLGWAGVASLPRLKLETPAARSYLWGGKDSVVQHYLKKGIDGWRLDVAFELGPTYLTELTKAAHRVRPGSSVVGEISGYPSEWVPAVDGVFNFSPVAVAQKMLDGSISGGRAGRILSDMVRDTGLEPLLQSWLLAENHDTPRLASTTPAVADRKVTAAVQFTFPGSPCVYYGQELGMTGKGDPENRAPMRWDLVNDQNPDYHWMKQLIAIRKRHVALRIGDYRGLETDRLVGFARTTNKLSETVIVLINPTDQPVQEVISTRVGKLLSWGELRDEIGNSRVRSINGLMNVTMGAKSVMILTPVTNGATGYSPYDRVDG